MTRKAWWTRPTPRDLWEAMTKEERLAEQARRSTEAKAWWAAYPEELALYRERSRSAWRERYPQRAAVRDEILAVVKPEPCVCGSLEVVLFVTDYEARSFVWRCRPCARRERELASDG